MKEREKERLLLLLLLYKFHYALNCYFIYNKNKKNFLF